MEYCSSGDLYQFAYANRGLSEGQARFCAANVVLALEELHNNMIICRDVKPENLVIDEQGYLKLIDFNLACVLQNREERVKEIAGTKEYLAPEVLKGKGGCFESDFWSLACTIYELLRGETPFKPKEEAKQHLFEAIIYNEVYYYKYWSEELKDLLKALFVNTPTK